MGVNFTQQERSALYRLLADDTSDIILKTDREGFVVHASPAISRLGVALRGMLIGPHIVDLFHPDSAEAVRAEHAAAIGGRRRGQWIECRTLTGGRQECWFEMQLRPLSHNDGEIYGTIGIMRSLEERRALEEQLFAAAMTDPLTGLTNRRAFTAMLQHLVDQRVEGCLALFAIDHFKAINMKHGPSVGDDVLVAFADFLRTLVRANDIVSRVSDGKLGVLLVGASPDHAEAMCQRTLATLADLGRPQGASGFAVTASGGVARIAGSLDSTLKRAEMALFFARANGRGRLGTDKGPQSLLAKPG